MRHTFALATLSWLTAFSCFADQTLSVDDIVSLKEELERDRIALLELRESLAHLDRFRLSTIDELSQEVTHGKNEIAQLKEHYQKRVQNYDDVTCTCPPLFQYRPRINETAVTTSVDFLWWRAEEGALVYAIKGQPTPPTGQAQGPIGQLEAAEFSWDPGFRVALGYRFNPNFWEATAEYTYINSSGSDTLYPPANDNFLIGTWTNLTAFPILRLTNQIDLRTHVLDFNLARRFLFEDHMFFRLMMGLTGAWIDQEWRFKYMGNNDAEADHKHTWEFNGGGMRVGLDMEWYIGAGFSLLGKISGASLVGFYENKMFGDTNNATNNRPPATVQNSRYGDQRLVYHTQYMLGPMWGKIFDWWGLEIFAGYELNTWFNLQEQSQSVTETTTPLLSKHIILSNGTVGYQGLTAYLKLNF